MQRNHWFPLVESCAIVLFELHHSKDAVKLPSVWIHWVTFSPQVTFWHSSLVRHSAHWRGCPLEWITSTNTTKKEVHQSIYSETSTVFLLIRQIWSIRCFIIRYIVTSQLMFQPKHETVSKLSVGTEPSWLIQIFKEATSLVKWCELESHTSVQNTKLSW